MYLLRLIRTDYKWNRYLCWPLTEDVLCCVHIANPNTSALPTRIPQNLETNIGYAHASASKEQANLHYAKIIQTMKLLLLKIRVDGTVCLLRKAIDILLKTQYFFNSTKCFLRNTTKSVFYVCIKIERELGKGCYCCVFS